MSRCRLQIELDRPGAVYAARETLTGHVAVQVRQRCECRALTLDCAWDLPGTDSSAAHTASSSSLFEGVWEPGQYRYPFEFIVPNGPFTYAGKLFKIRWLLKARADLPLAVDPKAKTWFTLVPGPTDEPVNHGPAHDRQAAPDDHEQNKKKLVLWAIAAMFFGLACVYMVIVHSPAALWQTLVGIGFAGAGGLGGLGLLYLAFRNTLAQRVLGPVEVQITPDGCAPGSTLACTLRFCPPTDVPINAIELSLVGQELAFREDGEGDGSYVDHLIHQDEQRFYEGHPVRAGQEVSLTTQFTLPAEAPYTFATRNAEVAWKLTAHIDLPRYPDWFFYHPITVTPALMNFDARIR